MLYSFSPGFVAAFAGGIMKARVVGAGLRVGSCDRVRSGVMQRPAMQGPGEHDQELCVPN